MTKDLPKRNLTTGDIAKLCGVNFRTVIRWIQRGHLKAFQLPGRGDNRVQLQDFLQFLRDNDMPIPEELQPAGRRVLLVDHDAKSARSLQKALEKADFETTVATDGFSAGSLASSLEPAVIVVDPTMPGLGGVDVVRSLRDNPQTATARLVVVGDMSQADLEACVEAGADAAYRKPVKPSELVASVETMVSSPNPFLA